MNTILFSIAAVLVAASTIYNDNVVTEILSTAGALLLSFLAGLHVTKRDIDKHSMISKISRTKYLMILTLCALVAFYIGWTFFTV